MDLEVSEGSGTNATSDDQSVQTLPRRAKLLEYFQPELVEVNGVMKAICKYCGAMLRSSSTNSLRNHVADTCPKISVEDRKQFIATMEKGPAEASFVFDSQKARECMVKWCISAEVAFNKFDDPFFAQWMESMQPSFSGVGRQTMQNDCITRFKMMRQELRNELQSLNSRICLTTNLWTSNQKLGYLCLTAHYINADFILKKKIIAFKYLKYPHTGLAIKEGITECLKEWGIKEKMFTITLDNVSNNLSVRDLRESGLFGGDLRIVQCCAHILILLVQDGMAIAHGAIYKIRELVRHINSSPSRIQAFNGIAERSGLPSKDRLILDVPNRWNSTHDMIMEAIEYKVVLKRYAEEQLEPSPNDEEWTNSEAIGEFLEAFEKATKAFSTHRSPTSHLFLHNVLCIHRTLRNTNWQINCVLKDSARAMDAKFDKYWEKGKYNMTLVLATILDPSKKMDFLDFFYEKMSQYFVDIQINVVLVKQCLTKLFEKYATLVQIDNKSSPFIDIRTSNLGSTVLGKRRLDEEFSQWSQIRGRRFPKSELDTYLEEELVRIDERFEILNWWRTNANKYPVLSAMARDILAIPLSTVPSEFAFSAGGRILDDNRSTMTPETLECFVCCKDWLYEYPNIQGRFMHHSAGSCSCLGMTLPLLLASSLIRYSFY
eukprot:XP_020408604.1 zinc finger BED domain-containing protein DAYSLEEPER isoform X2 [Zea mays]